MNQSHWKDMQSGRLAVLKRRIVGVNAGLVPGQEEISYSWQNPFPEPYKISRLYLPKDIANSFEITVKAGPDDGNIFVYKCTGGVFETPMVPDGFEMTDRLPELDTGVLTQASVIRHSEETKARMRQSNHGCTITQEGRDSIRESNIRRLRDSHFVCSIDKVRKSNRSVIKLRSRSLEFVLLFCAVQLAMIENDLKRLLDIPPTPMYQIR